MINHEITLQALDTAARRLPPGQPVHMLNLWRFREQAYYADGSDQPSCTGREALETRYIPAFRRLAAGTGATRLFGGAVLANIVAAEGERWDVAALNRYPDFAAFRAVVETEAYRREAQPHRLAALEDFRLFAIGEVG